jgi:VWFA-related protein
MSPLGNVPRRIAGERASARTTIRQFIGQGDTASSSSGTEACRRSVVGLGVIENALKVMTRQAGLRRAMLVVSDGRRPYWGPRQEKCSDARKAFDRVVAASAVANVSIYGVDVSGQASADRHGATAQILRGEPVRTRRPSDTPSGDLAMLSGITGGTVSAVVDGVAEGVHQLVRDSRQYYRVTYRQREVRSGSRDGFRTIEVRVRRPGVEVRTQTRNVVY